MTDTTVIAPFMPERFDAAVEHYVAARTQYAPELIAWLARETGVGGARVLDLGCGPGFIANAVAPWASDVLGLDPSPNMIAAAREAAAPNARFEVGSSEDLSVVGAPVRLVTMGRSFHWMRREQTLRDLDGLVGEGGAVALLNDTPADTPSNRWWRDVSAVTKRFAVIDAYNQFRMSDGWVSHQGVLTASAFSALRRISVFQEHSWTFERLRRHTLSRSSTTEALIGGRMADFEAALRQALASHGPEPWTTLNEHTALIARRPAAHL